MNGLTRDGMAEPFSRDKNFRRERGQGKKHFPYQLITKRIGNPYSAESVDHTHAFYLYTALQTVVTGGVDGRLLLSGWMGKRHSLVVLEHPDRSKT